MNKQDSILDGITYGELLETVVSNCGSQATVKEIENEFLNLMKLKGQDAFLVLRSKLKEIEAECKLYE